MQHQEDVSQVHKVKNLSIAALCKCYNINVHESIEALKASSKKDPKFWTRRPLENDALALAALEVTTLVTNLFPRLKR